MDQQLFLWMNNALSGTFSTWFFGAVTWLGNGLVLALLIVPAMAWKDRANLRSHLLPLVVSVAITGVAVNLAKVLIGRERPPIWAASQGLQIHVPFGIPTDMSFPSGHSQTSFGAAVYLSLLYPRGAPAFMALAALVGVSRIALGVHFPSDVMVGALVGSLGSWVAFRWAKRRKAR